MFCEQCGTQMPDDSVFCPNCGAKNEIKGDKKVESNISGDTSQINRQEEVRTPIPVPPTGAAYVDLNAPMTVGNYIVTLILLAIPLVNFILLLIWAFGSNVNKNKKNLSIAVLIFMIISIVVSIILYVTLGLAVASLFKNLSYY